MEFFRSGDPPLGLVYLVVVYGGVAPSHEAVLVELPVFVAVRPPPFPVRVAALVLEADADAVLVKRPQIFPEPVFLFTLPLARQEFPYRLAPGEEFVAVAPLGVLGVREGHLFRVAGVPGVFGGLDFLLRGLLGERREWWAWLRHPRYLRVRAGW